MIFVDTNVLMYAVGGAHPLRDPARRFFEETLEREGAWRRRQRSSRSYPTPICQWDA